MKKLLVVLALLPTTLLAQNSWINIQYLTDNYPTENSWELLDSYGSVVIENDSNWVLNTLLDTIVPLDAGTYTFNLYDTYGDGLNLWPGIAKTDFSDEEWTHVAGTYDKNTRTAKIYKNGIEQDSFTIPEGTCGSCRLFWDDIADVELKIGYGDNMPNQNYFNGSIDDVRIWDIALDQNIIECTDVLF